MDLPSISDMNECNRVVVMASQLAGNNGTCDIKDLFKLCSSLTFGGHIADHSRTINLCCYGGLLCLKNDRVGLTELGEKFLSCNPDTVYEITELQKHLIAERLILAGPWQSRARDLFLSFSPNYDKITYEISLYENPLPARYNSIVHLLLALRVLSKIDSKLFVEPKYISLVMKLRAAPVSVSKQELDQALQVDMKLANQAEEAVLEFERERLKSIGRNMEASLVRRISQLDIGAGYDIKSFDGDKPFLDYDRFIEVKSSLNLELRFFWSDNERRVAEERGDKYWIYFVGGLSTKKARHVCPIMIQDPSKRLAHIPNISIKPATYIVKQGEEIQLRQFYQGKVKGFLL